MKITPIKTRIFLEGENLEKFITEHISHVSTNSIVVITSKIAALAEKRTASIRSVKEKEKLIRTESEWAAFTKYAWLSIKDGSFAVAGGIDESNARGKLILLPKNSFDTAAKLRKVLTKKYNVKSLGIVLTDSRSIPLRAGIIGLAVGYAGFRGLKDYKGTRDLFGREMKTTKVDIADSLATAAIILMGEGAECQPLAIIEGAPVEFSNHVDSQELVIPAHDDLYAPLFKKLHIKKRPGIRKNKY